MERIRRLSSSSWAKDEDESLARASLCRTNRTARSNRVVLVLVDVVVVVLVELLLVLFWWLKIWEIWKSKKLEEETKSWGGILRLKQSLTRKGQIKLAAIRGMLKLIEPLDRWNAATTTKCTPICSWVILACFLIICITMNDSMMRWVYYVVQIMNKWWWFSSSVGFSIQYPKPDIFVIV